MFQVISDQCYEFPYKNMKALASQGLLGLIIPKEYGGLGQNHVCMTMVVETIARYGCPSTAMVCGECSFERGYHCDICSEAVAKKLQFVTKFIRRIIQQTHIL